MNLLAGKQMPDHVESAIDHWTDVTDSNKDIYKSHSDSDK